MCGLKEKVVSSNEIFNGRILKVKLDKVLLPNGKISSREVVLHPGAVAILPILPNGDIVFVKQYRYPIDSIIYELPAGKLELNEKPLKCAIRELSEETGYDTNNLEFLTTIVTTPGFSNENIYLYLAKNLIKSKQHLDEDEFIDVEVLSVSKVKQMILEGNIFDSKTLSALLVYLLKK